MNMSVPKDKLNKPKRAYTKKNPTAPKLSVTKRKYVRKIVETPSPLPAVLHVSISSQVPIATKGKNVKKAPNDIPSNIAYMMAPAPVDRINDAMRHIHDLRTQSGHLARLTENELFLVLDVANEHYRNANPIMSDNEYDIVENKMKERFPDNLLLKRIGAPVVGKKKTVLPYEMWSMDKIKPDSNAIETYKTKYKGPFVVSCKLDGVSGMYVKQKGQPKLYTRGDGTEGQDISHLISALKLPNLEEGMAVRGEFIMPKSVFEQKYKAHFANPRNLVSGIINSKKVDVKATDLHFVAYELVHPPLKASQQMQIIQSLGFETVQYLAIDVLSNDILSNILTQWRTTYLYEIDGIIVADDHIHERISGNPKHAFAFKMTFTADTAECMVVDVLWNVSKDGYLKPRVQIEPVRLSGVSIEFVTGYNAKFIQDNMIGIGATVSIIRSGDVIPKIIGVTHPAILAKMPDIPYRWNDTHVDIVLEESDGNEDVLVKNIGGFFTGIGVEGLGPGNVEKIIHAGWNTIPRILKMTKANFLGIDGFKDKLASKLMENIEKSVREASLSSLMSSSNIFGRGFSKVKTDTIIKSCPDILVARENASVTVQRIVAIKGFSVVTAQAFVSKIPTFVQFIRDCDLIYKLHVPIETSDANKMNESHPLYGKSIVFTGFRSIEMEKRLQSIGARIGSSIPKKNDGHTIVVVKDLTSDSVKIQHAKSVGIPLLSASEIDNLLSTVIA